jgi:hypothetical protein
MSRVSGTLPEQTNQKRKHSSSGVGSGRSSKRKTASNAPTPPDDLVQKGIAETIAKLHAQLAQSEKARITERDEKDNEIKDLLFKNHVQIKAKEAQIKATEAKADAQAIVDLHKFEAQEAAHAAVLLIKDAELLQNAQDLAQANAKLDNFGETITRFRHIVDQLPQESINLLEVRYINFSPSRLSPSLARSLPSLCLYLSI